MVATSFLPLREGIWLLTRPPSSQMDVDMAMVILQQIKREVWGKFLAWGVCSCLAIALRSGKTPQNWFIWFITGFFSPWERVNLH